LYVYKNWDVITCWKGYRYDRHCTIYLFISNCHYYAPIKLRASTGPLHLFTTINPLIPAQVSLRKQLIWDVLQIDWGITTVNAGYDKISMPAQVAIPLLDKYRLRYNLVAKEIQVHLMIKQGVNWYKVTETAPPITTNMDPDVSP
jgi:hypothetical protein